MDLENTGTDWKDEAPLLAAMPVTNPFIVPDNYFTGLNESIKSRCLIEEVRFNNEDEFPIPAGYFESLSSRIEGRISEEKIRAIVPSDGFSVPENYFSGLEHRILAKTNAAEKPAEASVRPFRSNWLRYAAAACVTLAVGSALILNNRENSFDSQLGSLPDQEIINYLQLHSDLGDTPLIMESLSQNLNLTNIGNEISDAELEDYINTTL